jgi:hypothetical protein
MKQIFPFLFVLLSISTSGQSDVTNVFEISPTLYDLGSKVFPNGDGYAVFGTSGGSSASNGDIFLLRLDQNGNELGRHFLGLSNKTEGIDKGVVPVGNNGWLVAGWQEQAPSDTRLGYLVRVAANGSVLWSKTISGPGLSGVSFRSLAALPNGGYMAAATQGSELMILRLTEDGEVVWFKDYNYEVPRGMYVSASGGNCFIITRNHVLKVRTSNGQISWNKQVELPVFGDPEGDILVTLSDIKSIGNGQFALAATALNDAIFDFEQAPYASVWNESGEILWSKAFPGNLLSGQGGGTGNALMHLPNSNELLLTGESPFDGINVTRVSVSGAALEVNNIPTPSLCIAPELIKHQGRYIATGGCFTNGMNTLFYRSGGNWLPSGNLRPNERSAISVATPNLYPNPATTILHLDFRAAKEEDIDFQIVNKLGQMVRTAPMRVLPGDNTLNVDIQYLPAGMYWLFAANSEFPPTAWVKE